jgi:hypothetical protein
MSQQIRPIERADLADVAKLYELVMRSGRSDPPAGLASYFARNLLDPPWVDEEIPSLVCTDANGSIVAFLGSSVRRARFDGNPIRIGCAGQLVAHPDARSHAVGAMLLRAYLGGRQELSITDTASDAVRQMWMLLGGQMVHLSCITWVRILRPWRLGERLLRERWRASPRALGRRLPPVLDVATVKSVSAAAPPGEPSTIAEPLTPGALLEHHHLVAKRVRLYVDYDGPFLKWLFGELLSFRASGDLTAHLIRARDGRVLGWYVYYLLPGGISRVLQVAANDRDVGSVIDHMFHHAWSGGSAAVLGRVEPRLLEPLAHRRSVLLYAGPAALAHSREPEIVGAISSGNSLLTRLDGEWWMNDRMVDLHRSRV